MPRRPNFLIFLTDQHRPDHTGFGGATVVRTPHLDGIAARGLRLDRAIVSNPICMPNRSTLFTGRLPSTHGVRFNGVSLDPDASTFVRTLRANGWRTAQFGKLHLQNMGVGEAMMDRVWKDAAPGDSLAPARAAGWDLWENEERHRNEKVEIPPDFYGLDEVDLTVNHADQASGHYWQWLLEQGVDPRNIQGPQNALPYTAQWNQVWRTATPEALYPTRYVTERTAGFLMRQANTPDTPFVAFCSYPDPHHPFTPPGHYFDLYDPAKIPLPETFDDPHEHSMPHFRRMLAARGGQGFLVAPFAPTEAQWREAAAAEFGMVSMIDDGVGEVLAALSKSGRAEDTIVIFTSDHGDMFGDHGMMLKAAMHYEGCLRVPLVIAVPGKRPGVSRSLVSTLDLAQTILALADCPAYYGMQGHSLAPLLDDPGAKVRDHVLVEEDQMFDMAGLGQPLRMRTLVTEDARLTLYQGAMQGELFDLAHDARELHNLWDEPSARAQRGDLMERLARVQMGYADLSPKPSFLA